MSHQYFPPRTDDVHFRLKVATKDLHSRVERVPILERLLTAQTTREDYSNYLLAMLTFIQPLEKLLQSHAANPFMPCHLSAQMSESLRLDLHEMGLQSLHQYKPCTELPEVNSIGRAFGILYVLEGSLLGGRLIRAHLKRLNLPPNAFHFLNGYGDKTLDNWREFMTAAQRLAETQSSIADEMVEAAQDTFQKMESWLIRFPSCLTTGA